MEPVTEPGKYHVFINHRGPDTKMNIAILIHRELERCGLKVFLDMKELQLGDVIIPAIAKAIDSASVYITIFSKRYAESRPCLHELCRILKYSPQRKIIPVFYDVQPCQLRGIEREPYAEAFQNHQCNVKVSETDVAEWKKALRDVSEISGRVFFKTGSNYAKFLDKIVQVVLKDVKQEPFQVTRHLVGLDQALENLENKIQKQSAQKLVGISGIGGVGKSTLAKHYFYSRRDSFNKSCYLSVGERKVDLTSLQRQLVRAFHGNDFNIPDTETGKTILQNSVKGFKILIVLDDVEEREQIKRLLDIDAVELGSRILVTCRDKNILEGYNPLWYDLQPLQRMHAQKLFCQHAFLKSEPLEGYKELVKEFLDICGGLPFCLEIWGKQLAGCDRTYWKQQLKRFSQAEPLADANRVMKTLRVSYESMYSNEEKELFLDLGCFFVGEDKELAVRVSEGLGYYYDVENHLLENLRKKCLVHFEYDAESHHEIENSGKDLNREGNRYLIQPLCKFRDGYKYVESYLPAVLPQTRSKVIMLSPVRELARHIVRETRSRKKPLRLSCSIDIEKMLDQDGSESRRIRGILIPTGQNPPQLTNTIKGVRLLVVEHPIDLSAFFGSAIKLGDLVWLRLCDFGCISIPPNISMRCLRVLEFQGPSDHLEKLFDHLISSHEKPTKLCVLSIDAKGGASASTSSSHDGAMPSFHRFLEWIGTELKDMKKIVLKNIPLPQSLPIDFANLGNLDLSGSTNLTKLRTLPIDFSNLRNLTYLDLSGSTDLTELPISFSQLSQLQHLALRDCKKLSIPRGILEKISTLVYIDFKGCAQLERLPEGIASQTRLRYLNLLCCNNLQELPLNLQLLDKLEHLRIGSQALKTLPHSVASLKGLKELIMECQNLDNIAPIEELKLLERLDIYGSRVKTISPRWENVKVLTIHGSPITEFSFQSQDVMDALRDFTLAETSISKICIPLNACPALQEVDLSDSSQLDQVPDFPQTLVRLTLKGCSKLKTLTNLSNLVHLRFLNINECSKLETLNVGGLTSLEEISAEKCWKLQTMESFNKMGRLNFLCVSTDMQERHLSNASEFEKIMQSLQHVNVPPTTTPGSPEELDNVLSHKAVFLCFITNRASDTGFCVRFEPENNLAQYVEYKTFRGGESNDEGGESSGGGGESSGRMLHPQSSGGGGESSGRMSHIESSGGGESSGRMLHMYMWTKDSKLFQDGNMYTKVVAYRSGSLNEFDAGDGEKGWIVTLGSETNVLEVCKVCKLIMSGGINTPQGTEKKKQTASQEMDWHCTERHERYLKRLKRKDMDGHCTERHGRYLKRPRIS